MGVCELKGSGAARASPHGAALRLLPPVLPQTPGLGPADGGG